VLLAELMDGAREDAQEREREVSLAEITQRALEAPEALRALDFITAADHIKVIAEVKRASPSRGDMAEIADPAALASLYESAGASIISVLTEGRRFKGSLDDLRAVRAAVKIPVLRKDFISSPYQVFEARAAGADLVLLIVAALDDVTLAELFGLISSLGMTALVEAHSADEVRRAVDLGAELIGINARDLNTFELDRDLFGKLAEQIPAGIVRVAESAVRTASDVAHYRRAGADAVLVGEALVTNDPVVTLTSFLEI
jgi:indole-3-glycerol phosphate synthase